MRQHCADGGSLGRAGGGEDRGRGGAGRAGRVPVDRGAPRGQGGRAANRTEAAMGKLLALAPTVATVSLLSLGGCASRGDVDQLRSDIAGLRSSVEAADARAAQAQAE